MPPAEATGLSRGLHQDFPQRIIKGVPASISAQLRRQRLVHFRAGGAVGQFPHRGENRSRHFFHLLIINLVGRITDLVIILVDAVEIEDDRDAFFRVVEMIAAVKESLGVGRVVVFVVEIQLEITRVFYERSS